MQDLMTHLPDNRSGQMTRSRIAVAIAATITLNTATVYGFANSDPFGEGWLVRVTMSDPSEIDNLMTAEEYEAFTSGLS